MNQATPNSTTNVPTPLVGALALATLLLTAACGSTPADPASSAAPNNAADASKTVVSCDDAALTALAKTLDQERNDWSAESGHAMRAGPRIAQGIRAACPGADFDSMLARLEVKPDRYAAAAHHRPENTTFASRVCPQIEAVAKSLPGFAGPERPGALYDGCKLDTTTKIPRDSFVQAGLGGGAVDLLGLRFALQDAGVREESAISLSEHAAVETGPGQFIHPGPKLPVVSSSLSVMPSAVLATLTAEGATFDGRPETIAWADVEQMFDPLSEEFEREKQLEPEPDFVFAADRDLPWSTIQSFLVEVKRAEIREPGLLVLTNDAVYPYRRVSMPTTGDPAKTLGQVLAGS